MQKQNEQKELEHPVQPIDQDAMEQVTGGGIESANVVGYSSFDPAHPMDD